MSSENNRSAPDGATPQPESVMRLLRDPEALAAIERLAFLGYSSRQVGLAMEAGPAAGCYTCELLGSPIDVDHEHTFGDLMAAEVVERGVRPRRSRALWELVARAKAAKVAKRDGEASS